MAEDTTHTATDQAADQPSTVVYCITAANRPGMAHSIAAVFAHRGLSIDTFVSDSAREPTRILAEFTGTNHQQHMVQRSLERLHYVTDLAGHPIASPRLRGVVLCMLRPRKRVPALANVELQHTGRELMIHGQLLAVTQALEVLRRKDLVESASRSIIAM